MIFQNLLDRSKADKRLLVEQLRTMLGGNSHQIELVSSENEKIHQAVQEVRSRQSGLSNAVAEYNKKFADIEGTLDSRFTDIKTTFNAMKEAIKESHANEVQSILRGQGDMTKRFDDNYSKLLDRLELNESLNKRRFDDIEKTVSHFGQEFSVSSLH